MKNVGEGKGVKIYQRVKVKKKMIKKVMHQDILLSFREKNYYTWAQGKKTYCTAIVIEQIFPLFFRLSNLLVFCTCL